MTHMFKKNSLVLMITSIIATGNCAYAAEPVENQADEKDEGVPTIIITARKTAEDIQTVPVSVTSLSADDIAESGMTDVTDVQQYAANTTLQVSRGTSSTLTAYIRGIGQQDPLWGFEPGVGVYVDDVYIARPQGAVMEILDIDRIEVLRGPQGTLYGKNTIGGAMKYVTRQMTGDREFGIETTFGNYGLNNYKISGQMPFNDDKFYLGFAVADINRDGFGEFKNTGDDNYNKDILAGRLNFEYHPSDDLFFRLAYDNTDDKSNAKGGYRMVPSLLTGQQPYDSVYDSDTSLGVDNRVQNSGTSFTVNWDVNDDLSFKSVTASRDGNTETNIDFDNTALKSFDVPAVYDDNQFTQEFQLSYVTDDVTAVGGVYYYQGDACGSFDVQLEVLGLVAFGVPFTLENGGCVSTDSYSAYGQSTFSLDEKWSMTLGARYTQDTKDADVYRHSFFQTVYPGELEAGTAVPTNPNNKFSGKETWNHFSPRVGVEYHASDDLMYYASYTDGFKSGGFNMRADFDTDPDGALPFDPEIVDTYEIGLKSDPTEDLRFNAAYFFSDYQDMQVTVQRAIGNGNFAARVLNAGQAEIQGVELESVWAASEKLLVTIGLGYIDAKFVEFINTDPVTGNLVDQADILDISNTPDLSANLSLSYDVLTSYGDIVLSANAAYRADTQIFEAASPLDEDAYTLVNFGATFYHEDGNWTGSLQVKNAFDKEVRVAGYCFATGQCPSGSLGLEDTVVGYYGDPRTVALTVGYQF